MQDQAVQEPLTVACGGTVASCSSCSGSGMRCKVCGTSSVWVWQSHSPSGQTKYCRYCGSNRNYTLHDYKCNLCSRYVGSMFECNSCNSSLNLSSITGDGVLCSLCNGYPIKKINCIHGKSSLHYYCVHNYNGISHY